MSILIAYLKSSQRIKSDEYDIIDMMRDSIFCSLFLDILYLTMDSEVPDIFGGFLSFRVGLLFFGMSIFSKAIFSINGRSVG
jgi:hypothetical protein